MQSQRNLEILEMRKAGKTLAAIGRAYGLSAEQIRCICKDTQRKLDEPTGLSARALNVLKYSFGLSGDDLTRERVSEITEAALKAAPNCGAKTIEEIFSWKNQAA